MAIDTKSALEIVAVSCVLFPKVVVRFTELPESSHATTSPLAKFDPVTVKVTSEAPAVVLVGEIEAIEGEGGGGGGGCSVELPPPQPVSAANTNKNSEATAT